MVLRKGYDDLGMHFTNPAGCKTLLSLQISNVSRLVGDIVGLCTIDSSLNHIVFGFFLPKIGSVVHVFLKGVSKK